MNKPSASSLSPQEKATLVKAVTRALGYTENGGRPNLAALKEGKSGELKSIFQFTPDTWKGMAQKYLGDANAPITPDAETTVVSKQVSDWIDEGKTIKQMGSMWNAGHGEPDAYTGKFSNGQSSIGLNNKGVKFNVPAYANTVNDYAKQFYTQMQSQQQNQSASQSNSQAESPSVTISIPAPQSNLQSTLKGLLPSLASNSQPSVS